MHKTDPGKRLGEQTTSIREHSDAKLCEKGTEYTKLTERDLFFTERPSTHYPQIKAVSV